MTGKTGEYEGRLVGKRKLEALLGVRGNTAFYLTKSTGRDQLIELVRAGAESAATLASWDHACDLSDGPFLRVYATGKAELDGTGVAYAVVDLPQDDLGEILSRRTLDEAEARSMFSAVARALQALHQLGLAHGAVKPSNIFVVQDETRLSIDNLAPAGKHGKEQDLREFGATLVKAMTGCTDEALVDTPAIARAAAQLPSPFRQIAVGCVGGSPQGKWTAARVVEVFLGRSPETTPRVLIQWPIIAGAGIGAVVLLFYVLFHGPRHPAPTNPAIASNPVPAHAEVARTPEPAAKPAPVAAGAADRKLARQKASETSTESWAVIAGTYGHFEAAQKHAEIYGKQFPQLQPHVFPPEGQGKHYLIVFRSGLTQEAAERLRHDLVQQGAPPDTYVTKIAEN